MKINKKDNKENKRGNTYAYIQFYAVSKIKKQKKKNVVVIM